MKRFYNLVQTIIVIAQNYNLFSHEALISSESFTSLPKITTFHKNLVAIKIYNFKFFFVRLQTARDLNILNLLLTFFFIFPYFLNSFLDKRYSLLILGENPKKTVQTKIILLQIMYQNWIIARYCN